MTDTQYRPIFEGRGAQRGAGADHPSSDSATKMGADVNQHGVSPPVLSQERPRYLPTIKDLQERIDGFISEIQRYMIPFFDFIFVDGKEKLEPEQFDVLRRVDFVIMQLVDIQRGLYE